MSILKTIYLQHLNGANANMTLDSSGRVGIGNTSPSYPLHVGGEIFSGRSDSSAEGGQLSLGRASDDFAHYNIDCYGGSTTPSLRFIDAAVGAVRMNIDSSGRVTTPYQPRVYATKTTGDWTNYGSSGTTFIFNNAIINVGNNYNSSTGIFTSPISGYYRVSAAILLGYGSGTTGFYLYKNGSAYGHSVYVATYSTSVHATTGFNWMVNCSAGDTLKIHAWSGSSTTVYEPYYNHLLIELIG